MPASHSRPSHRPTQALQARRPLGLYTSFLPGGDANGSPVGLLLSGGILMARERTAMLILLRKVVLNQEQGCPPGDIRRYLKTCLVVTAGAGRERGWYLLGRGYARSLRNTLQQSTGQTPPKRTVRPHMSLVLGLRKPELENRCSY